MKKSLCLVLVFVSFAAGGCLGTLEAEPTVGGITTDTDTTDTDTTDTDTTDTAAQPPKPCVDADHDGFCRLEKSGKVVDCNDTDTDTDGDGVVDGFNIHPGATEICNMIDDNCDGAVDEDLLEILNFADADGDGFGDISDKGEETCLMAGFVTNTLDCDDDDANIHPGAEDKPGDGVDSDCDDETEPEQLAKATLTVGFASEFELSMSYQLFKGWGDVGNWWDATSEGAKDSVTAEFTVPKEACGVRFNVTIGVGDDATWACVGSGSTASINGIVAHVELNLGGEETYDLRDVQTWSAPEGAGCSLLVLWDECDPAPPLVD